MNKKISVKESMAVLFILLVSAYSYTNRFHVFVILRTI